MKYKFFFITIIFLIIFSGCQSIQKNNFALVVTPVYLPVNQGTTVDELSKGPTGVLFGDMSLYDFLKNKNYIVEIVSNDPFIYRIPDQEGLLEELAKILNTLRVITSYYYVNIANVDTTKTETGKPYRRKGFIISKDFEIEKIVDVPGNFKKIYDPEHPDADKYGYLYLPNVNLVEEAKSIINIQRIENGIIKIIEKINKNSVAFGSNDYYKLHLNEHHNRI